MSRHIFAASVFIDEELNETYIDGVRIPWWLAMPGPTIEDREHDSPFTTINLPIMVDGVVFIRLGEHQRIIDPVIGDVGEYARRTVREGFQAAYPWLELPA